MAQRQLPVPTFDELYREIEALPHGVTGEILAPGTLRTMSRPGEKHRRAAKHLLLALGGADRDQRGVGWWIEVEAGIALLDATRLVVPDLAGWRVERVPDRPTDNPITTVPDWVCEVHSPSTRADDRHLKLPLYVAAGVPWIWMVDPEARLVEVYVPDGEHAKLVGSGASDELLRLPPFDLDMPLAPWWSDATR